MSEYKTIDNGFWNVSKPFKIITSASVLDINEDDKKVEMLGEEQDKILNDLGFETYFRPYLINFGNKSKGGHSIYDAIQMLALKDGADLVQFENGNYGYIGYYAGFNENWFEIIKSKPLSEHCELINGSIWVTEDGLDWLFKVDKENIEKAVDLIEWSISAWYCPTEYPEYESVCIGDVIEEKFIENGIDYEYIPCEEGE